MRYVLIFFLFVSYMGLAQKKEPLHLKNCVVIGQLDDPNDRYALEINLTDMLVTNGIKTVPSLNMLKLGGDAIALASDTLQQKLAEKGVDTYMLVSVRGYDRRFKVSEYQPDLKEALQATSLFNLYREDIVSVSIEFKFYRNNKFVYGDMIKCGNIGTREEVIKRLRNKMEKRIGKKWKR